MKTEEIQQEYPHEVWIAWNSHVPGEGCLMFPSSAAQSPEAVLSLANQRKEYEGGFDQAKLQRSKIPYEELHEREDRDLFLRPTLGNK